MVFETRKIQTETLSEYLFSIRQNLGMDAKKVVEKTGMSLKFLQSLETGKLNNLPADVYVYGFLRQLGQLYNINPEELVLQYKKEKGIHIQINKQNSSQNTIWYKKYFNKIVITPKVISILFGLFFVVSTILYIIWQVWSINKTPDLVIISPEDYQTVSGASVEVSGTTNPGMSVTVNGENVFVEPNGGFKTQLGLSTGPTQIVVTAANKFGKFTSKSINLSTSAESAVENILTIKIDFTDKVVLDYSIDNQPMQVLSFSAGDSKTFFAKQKISLNTTDAGATKVTLNGQLLGVLGKSKEVLKDVTFFPQAILEPANSK